MIRQYAAQLGAHIFKRRRWAVGCDHDRGTDYLAPLRVGAADDDGLGNGIELRERLLNQTRGHLEAASVDQVVEATIHDEGAAVIEVADVVGAEPCSAVRVFAEYRRSERRLAEVALGEGGAAELDPAVILEPHEADIKWAAVIDAAARRLAHAIRGDHMDPGVPGIGEQAGRCCRAADEDSGILGERLASTRRGEQPDQLGGDEGRECWCARGDLSGGSGERCSGEASRQIHRDRSRARDQRPDQDLDAGDVVGRHRQQPLALATEPFMRGVSRRAESSPRQHGQLGPSARA